MRTYGVERITLQKVKERQPEWFSRKNKKFFGDVSYRVLCGKALGERFLVRSTYAWTDMFDQPRKLHYRVNHIEDDLKIGGLVDDIFDGIDDVREWLKSH